MVEISTIEKYIFVLLLVSAVVVFLLFAKNVFFAIISGKPEPKRFNRLHLRIIRFIKEVLFQQRVVGGRPVVGLMHFGVFLGFIFFLFETSNTFLEPFGLAYLPPLLGDALPYFRTFILIISYVVVIGITGLAFRRFVLTKISPDPKSIESGIIALFILLLMLTYIDMHSTHLVYTKIDWWLHVVIILVFPILILNSKHLHLFLAPLNVFLRKFRLWEVEKMNLDIESAESEEEIVLGLETVAAIPWKLRLDFFTCVECKRCTDNCPASQAGMELRPADFIKEGRKALESGKSDVSVIGSIISEKTLGQCTSCMACENICPLGIEHSQLLAGAKAAQTLAIGTGGVAIEFFKNMTNYGNPFASGPDVRTALIEELNLPVFEKGFTEYALWLGCVWSYNPDFKKVVEATAASLKHAGVSFGVLKNEKCCGHHSRRQGEEMQFQTLARENAQMLKDEGVTKIITGCPHCLNTMQHEYEDFLENHKSEIKHHSQIFSELISSGCLILNSKSLSGQKLTYHDPCYLGRFEGIYRQPRFIIESTGGNLIEIPLNKKYSYCCGGGAAGFTIEQKGEKRIDQERKAQVVSTGISTLITSCPECKSMLTGAVETTKDISELIMETIEKS
ncbi:hypothetical protein AMJ80_05775 [bacterium SM23_31]|nr:MAG: hypothetical protein AMJ80_05775 [bacterium SM23_31]